VDKYSVTYNVNGSADVTDPLGATRNYTFQTILDASKSDAITGDACPSCGPKAQSFDSNGNVLTRTDWNGNRTDYTYDTTRNLETSRTEGLTSGGSTTAQTRTITTEWHSSFRLPKRIAEPLKITTFTYNGDGVASCGFKADGTTLVPAVLCSKSVQATTDTDGSQGFSATTTGSPRAWSYTYNKFARVLTVNGPRTDVTDTTTYTYHNETAICGGSGGCRGQIATITNAASHVTQITSYNGHGDPTAITDPNGLSITLTWDDRRRLLSRNVGGETTSFTYDFAGQLTRVTLPDSSYLEYTYDDAHRVTELEDNLGNRVVYTLDDMGNRTLEQVRDPSNALMQTRSRVYSSLNRLFQEIGASSQVTEYTYDDQGNVLTIEDPLSHTTTNQYDALNRLKQVTDPGTGVTQYGYNGQDALTGVTDPRSLATSYTVDGLGNLTQQVSPDTGTTANTYDAAGNLLTQTDAKSQVTTYSYDALNRVTEIEFHDGSKHIYAYDSGTNALGRLTSIEERNPSNTLTGSLSYAYDQKGRVTSNVRSIAGVGYTTGYRYDSHGRLDRITYPSGRTVDYSFDSLGRISGVTSTPSGGSAQTIASSITYQPFGGLKGLTFGNSQTYARSYDQDGRVNTYTLAGTSYTVLYDDASRIETITETLNPPNTNTYGYDVLDRLTSATLPATTYGYSYDAVGNRLTKTTGANTDTYTYGTTSNRISTLTPSSGPARSFTLDSNGSTTDDDLNTYAYDTRGRMVSATSSAGTTTYYLNALGQRVRKTNSGTDVAFHYDLEGHLIAESTAAGSVIREYIWLGDTPVAVISSGNRHYIHTDHLNTPRLISNGTPAPVWRWDQFEPFGVNVPDENPSGLGVFEFPLRLPGQYADKETNLYYNYFRDYDPEIGRYLQSDPIGLRGGLNTYAYVGSSPLAYSDPTGEAGPVSTMLLFYLQKCAVGAAVGATIEAGIQVATCCYKQCGLEVWRCRPMECGINACNVAVSAFASCVASVAFPNAPPVPVTWQLLKIFLQKVGAAGLLKQFGKYGCQ
jgi:RHS repeat-associated protein